MDLYDWRMYCDGCGYALRGLGAGLCPECGRGFDPEDPGTFSLLAHVVHREKRARRLEIALVAVGLAPLIANVFGFAAFLIARVSLGRWPYRMGRDDPYSDVPGIRLLVTGAILLIVLTFPALVAGMLILIAMISQRAWRRIVRGGLIAGALWSLGFMLSRWDPADVWMWLFD